MNLLFTGASGFLGKNVLPRLSRQYNVKTLGRLPHNDYSANLATDIPVLTERFDIVLHAAGKAHSIPKDEKDQQAFFDVNLKGTKNICSALEQSGVPATFIFISTVAVYGLDSGENITELQSLNAETPYAKSKKEAEEFLINWCHQHKVNLAILRPSLIAGPNAPGNLGAMTAAIKSGKYLSIAGGKARKSVLLAQDIADLVPLLISKGGIYNICDDTQPSFRQLELLTAEQLGRKNPKVIPFWLAKLMALAGDILGNKAPINSQKLDKITCSLTFSNEKAKRELGWIPSNVLEQYRV